MKAGDRANRRHLLAVACTTAVIGSLLGPAHVLAGGSLSASPPNLDYGSQTVATNESLLVSLDNTSSSSVTIGTVTVTGTDLGDFSADNSCDGQPLAGFGSCQMSVDFFPSSTGPKTASLEVPNSGSPSTISVPLSGTGVLAALTLAPMAFDFGSSVPAGMQSPPHAFTATGAGAGKVTIQDVTITGANADQFQRTGGSCYPTPPFRLGPAESCTVDVAFTPTTPGAKAATLEFATNAPDSPDTAALTGTATLGSTVVPFIPLLPTSVPATENPDCAALRAKLKKARTKRAKRRIRRQLRKLGC